MGGGGNEGVYHIATLGPEERPILSQRDEGWAQEWLNEDDLKWKMTSNIKTGISQQPLIGPFSNFKHKLLGPNQN